MKRESRLFDVATFLRPDVLELLSRDVDKKPTFGPLETEGDRADGQETFETDLLLVLLPVLSNEMEETLRDEESVGVDFTADFLVESCFPASELGNFLEVLPTGEMGTNFLISEMLGLAEGLVTTEGSELLRTSGSDRLNGSKEVAEVVFLPATELTLVCRLLVSESGCLSGKPPVLFLLVIGTELKLREVPLTVDLVRIGLVTIEANSEPPFGSILFLVVPGGPVGLTIFAVRFALSAGIEFLSLVFKLVSTETSPATTNGSSISVQ